MVLVALHLLHEDAGSQPQGPNRRRLAPPSAVPAWAGADQGSLWIRHPESHFEPGDIIFEQGDLGDSVYVIEEGECEVLHEQKNEQKLLATLNRGECFGEMALLSNRTRSATIRARNATNVLIIPKADFDKLRQSVPAFGDVFGELVKRRSLEGAPHSFPETAGCYGHPIPTPVAESELGPPPGFALS
jgi:signal-transduction protein with cAMP-binding, CBS, and nucleotidyltransferase domain